MSHEFESGAFFGKSPWHNLGTTLPEDSPARWSVEETIQVAGMDWQVGLADLFHDVTTTSSCESTEDRKRLRVVEDRKAVIRSSDRRCLGVVGAQYRPLQNREIFAFFQPLLDSREAFFETAGSLRGGRIVWVLARIMGLDDTPLTNHDTVRPYLLLSSSHDGTQATRVGFSPIRVECANLLAMAHSDSASRLLRIRHTESQHEALELARESMDLCRQEFRATAEAYRRMAEARINESDLRRYVKRVLKVDDVENDQIPTRTRNRIDRIVAAATGGIGQDGGLTLWDAYQGVTQEVTHAGNGSVEKKLLSASFGAGSILSQRALSLAINLSS